MKNTITVDGVEYVKKNIEREEELTIETFSHKETEAITKVIAKQFEWSNKQRTITKEMIEKEMAVMDAGNVSLIVAKTPQAKKILIQFIDADKQEQKAPTLKYDESNKPIRSRYATNYLIPALQLFDIFDESPNISVAKDYPITIENKHFRYILAPRVDKDEE